MQPNNRRGYVGSEPGRSLGMVPPDVEGARVVVLEVLERVLDEARHLVLGPEADRGGDLIKG